MTPESTELRDLVKAIYRALGMVNAAIGLLRTYIRTRYKLSD